MDLLRALPEKDKKGYINQLGLTARCVVVLFIIEYELKMIFFNLNACPMLSGDVILGFKFKRGFQS